MERPITSSSSLARVLRACGVLFAVVALLGTDLAAAQFTLTWTDNSNNESGFRIERAAGLNATSGFAEIATVGANVVSYVDAGLPGSTSYSYRVRAYNSAGNSSYSNVASGTTPPAASNSAPTITSVANQTIIAGTSTAALAFTVGDAETAAASLSVTRASSNTTLLPLSGIVLGGSGASRTVTVTPASGQTGTATVTLTVSDGALTASTSFTVTVNASNSAPTITAIANQTIMAGSSTGALSFTIADAETAADSLTVTRTSSNTTLVRTTGVVLGGSGANRTVTVTPVSGQTGTATITVSVSDGALTTSTSFTVTVVATSAAPTITTQPASTTVTPGAALTLSVSAQSTSTLTYQWYFNGVAITGATSATYTIPVAQRYNAGSYHVVVTGGGVSVTSSTATVTAGTAVSSGRLVNLSSRANAQVDSGVLIPGFVVTGSGNKRVLLRVAGPKLADFQLNGVLANPKLLLKRLSGTTWIDVATNLNWEDNGAGPALRQAFAEVSAFSFAAGSGDAALLIDLAPGSYTVFATGEQPTQTGLALVECFDAESVPGTARLGNLSTRGLLGTGSSVMITGFVIEDGPVTVLVRTVGPGLAARNVVGAAADPRMELHGIVNGSDQVLMANDDWGSNPDSGYTEQVRVQIGAFALAAGSKDAACVVTLPPGGYTVISDAKGTTGVGLVELFAAP